MFDINKDDQFFYIRERKCKLYNTFGDHANTCACFRDTTQKTIEKGR